MLLAYTEFIERHTFVVSTHLNVLPRLCPRDVEKGTRPELYSLDVLRLNCFDTVRRFFLQLEIVHAHACDSLAGCCYSAC